MASCFLMVPVPQRFLLPGGGLVLLVYRPGLLSSWETLCLLSDDDRLDGLCQRADAFGSDCQFDSPGRSTIFLHSSLGRDLEEAYSYDPARLGSGSAIGPGAADVLEGGAPTFYFPDLNFDAEAPSQEDLARVDRFDDATTFVDDIDFIQQIVSFIGALVPLFPVHFIFCVCI